MSQTVSIETIMRRSILIDQIINQPIRKDMLYITAYVNEPQFTEKLDYYMKPYISRHFDIIDILNMPETVDVKQYRVVLINSIIICPRIYFLVGDKIDFVKNMEHVVLLTHDLHDYTLNAEYRMSSATKIKKMNTFIPVLKDNPAKKQYAEILDKFNIKYLISIYDCPEFDFFREYLKNVNKFYIINHGHPTHIFYPVSCHKKYDILYYGENVRSVYPFRVRLTKLMLQQTNWTFRCVKPSNNIREQKLCQLINQCWLCIACISNFSYFVMKYLEISTCNSVVLGDINHQGYNIIGPNMVYVTNSMTNQEIIEKIEFYLSNKEILAAISYNKLEKVQSENYRKIVSDQVTICESIKNNVPCIFECPKEIESKELPITNSLIHNKEFISMNFITIIRNRVYVSRNILDQGLYAVVYATKNEYESFDVYDNHGRMISNRITYVKDKDKLYVAFNLKNQSTLKIVGNIAIIDAKFYKVTTSI